MTMSTIFQASLFSVAVTLMVSGCGQSDNQGEAAATLRADTTDASRITATWPTSLKVVGDGFPNAGDRCRVIGESEATANFLDHTATLVGCLSADDAARLGGTVATTVDGVTLVSVPARAAIPGDGDGQGDAKVAGTVYNATAQIRCAGYKGAPAGMCDAGVVRGTETGTYVDVTLPDSRKRTIFFNSDGSFLAFSTAEADGTAALQSGSSREGDNTIATLGTERYEIPEVFLIGD